MAEFKNELKGLKPKVVRDPFNFSALSYDNRSGPKVCAGIHQGVGKKQPVGKESLTSGFAVPQTSKCFSPDEVV